jgi:hypothetical protein
MLNTRSSSYNVRSPVLAGQAMLKLSDRWRLLHVHAYRNNDGLYPVPTCHGPIVHFEPSSPTIAIAPRFSSNATLGKVIFLLTS